jgi:hypothetical protein
LGDRHIAAQIVFSRVTDFSRRNVVGLFKILQLDGNRRLMENFLVCTPKSLGYLGDRLALHVHIAYGAQDDETVRLYRNGLIKFRGEWKRKLEYVALAKPISRIPLLDGRVSMRCPSIHYYSGLGGLGGTDIRRGADLSLQCTREKREHNHYRYWIPSDHRLVSEVSSNVRLPQHGHSVLEKTPTATSYWSCGLSFAVTKKLGTNFVASRPQGHGFSELSDPLDRELISPHRWKLKFAAAAKHIVALGPYRRLQLRIPCS